MDLAFLAVVSFGGVWVFNYYLEKLSEKFLKRKYSLDTTTKLLLQGAIFYVLLFVPADLGNLFLNNLKLTIEAVLGATAVYQAPKSVVRAGGLR